MQPSPYSVLVARIRQARRCRAHRKDGRACGCYAVQGAFVCRMHGGAAGQVKRKAAERLIEAGAYRALGAYLLSPSYRQDQELVGLAADRPVIEAFIEHSSRGDRYKDGQQL